MLENLPGKKRNIYILKSTNIYHQGANLSQITQVYFSPGNLFKKSSELQKYGKNLSDTRIHSLIRFLEYCLLQQNNIAFADILMTMLSTKVCNITGKFDIYTMYFLCCHMIVLVLLLFSTVSIPQQANEVAERMYNDSCGTNFTWQRRTDRGSLYQKSYSPSGGESSPAARCQDD